MKLIAFLTFLFITQAAISQVSCDEKKVSEAEEIRRTVENSLINAVSITKMLSSGTEIMAFYFESRLIKISATDNLSHSEQIFFNKETPRCYERSGYDNGKEYFIAYYLEDNRIFCKQDQLSGRYLNLDNNEEKTIMLKIEEYSSEIQ